jgi:hypothetical protein
MRHRRHVNGRTTLLIRARIRQMADSLRFGERCQFRPV